MSFDSPLFIFFLGAVLLAYWGLQPFARIRLFMLLGAGGFFLSGGNIFSLKVLLSYVLTSLLFARWIQKAETFRRGILFVALLLNFSALVVFRIYQMRNGEFPLGFSFYSFAAITYLVDVYQRRTQVNALEYSSAVAFFPTLVSGPIVRLRDLTMQLSAPETLTWPLARRSAVLIANGFFKKGISELISSSILESLAMSNPGLSRFAWLQVIVFVVKFYVDFSGYSDIAIGSAGLLGIRVPANFNLPFLATSIGDFWRRWHITLNQWMNEYVFKPLVYSEALAFLRAVPFVGDRLFEKRQYPAVLAAMLAIGLWHGLTLNFAVWGLYMGILLSLEMAFGAKWKALPPPAQILTTFFLVLNGYVIFMKPDLLGVLQMYSRMYDFTVEPSWIGFSYVLVVSAILIIPHFVDYILIRHDYFRNHRLAAGAAGVLFFGLHYLLDGFNGAPFEYFKF